MEPFALTSGSQFRPPTPGLYGRYERLLASDEYKRQVDAAPPAGVEKPTAGTPVVNRTLDQEAAESRIWPDTPAGRPVAAVKWSTRRRMSGHQTSRTIPATKEGTRT
jgi:hypothetical protein